MTAGSNPAFLTMKYFDLAKSYILVLRLLKRMRQFQAEGDMFRACVAEYYARLCSDDKLLIIIDNEMVHSDRWHVPIEVIEQEARDGLYFFRHGFSNWIKFKYEV